MPFFPLAYIGDGCILIHRETLILFCLQSVPLYDWAITNSTSHPLSGLLNSI